MKECNDCGCENSDVATVCVECGSKELVEATSEQWRGTDGEAAEQANWEKVAVVDNEVEAERLDLELNNQKIPHVLRSFHDSALDGMYQLSRGWGEVEVPTELKEEVLSILKDIRTPED